MRCIGSIEWISSPQKTVISILREQCLQGSIALLFKALAFKIAFQMPAISNQCLNLGLMTHVRKDCFFKKKKKNQQMDLKKELSCKVLSQFQVILFR